MSNSVNSGTKLFFSRFGGEQPIPPEFLAAMERKEEVQSVPNEVGPDALSDTVVESRVETNRKNERVRRTIKKKPGNITLSAIQTNDQGQPVQVTRTLFPTGTTPTEPTATTNVAIHNLGNGWSIQEVGVEGTYVAGVFTPGIFDPVTFRKQRDETWPERFRVSVPLETESHVASGTATEPSLSTGDREKSERQVTAFTKETSVSNRDTASAPTLQGQVFDARLAVYVPYDETIETAGTNIGVPNREVEPLGGGEELVKAPSVDLPESLVSYGYIQYGLPRELLAVDIIGTEQKEAVPSFRDPPELFLARFTRDYSASAPPEPAPPPQFWAQQFHGIIEYNEESVSVSHNESSHDSSGSSTHDSQEQGHHTNHSEHSSHTGSGSTGVDTTTTSNSGAPLVGDPQNNRSWGSEQTTDTDGSSDQDSDTTSDTTGSSDTTSSGNATTDNTSTSTRLALLRLSIPATLHNEIVVGSLTIPATTPTALPWGSWLTIKIMSEVGRFAWITDTTEIYLPNLP